MLRLTLDRLYLASGYLAGAFVVAIFVLMMLLSAGRPVGFNIPDLEQLKARGMKVQPPGDTLKAGMQKIGEQLTADWLKKAGAEGQAVIDAYRKM